MEDDNGLELSLGLSCGGSNGKLKGKDGGSSADGRIEEGGDLKMFLNTDMQKQDADDGSQRSDVGQFGSEASKESFFTNLVKPGPVAEASGDLHGSNAPQFARYGECWDANNKSKEVEEVKFDSPENRGKAWLEAGGKRKMLFEEMNHQKKHEREIQYSDVHGMKSPTVSTTVRTSHVSPTIEDASTAEIEDVAESEVEGSTTGLVMHHGDGTKQFMGGNRGYSEASKERYGRKQSNALPESDPRFGSITYGMSLPPMTAQYSSKISSINGESNTSLFPSARVMQSIPPAGNEGPSSHTPNPGNLSLTFGYSPVQLPVFNSERSWGLAPHSSYAGRNVGNGVPNSDRSEDSSNISRGNVQAPPQGPSEASPDDRQTSELAKGGGKQVATEEIGTSSTTPAEEGIKGNRAKEGSLEASAIRPGVAPGVKFGGCGSYPDLPWVSTTGPGPNGRTISGVTYRYEKNQIRIVCACHGSHMSPEEFVQHASADQQNPENNMGIAASSPNGNPANSAQN